MRPTWDMFWQKSLSVNYNWTDIACIPQSSITNVRILLMLLKGIDTWYLIFCKWLETLDLVVDLKLDFDLSWVAWFETSSEKLATWCGVDHNDLRFGFFGCPQSLCAEHQAQLNQQFGCSALLAAWVHYQPPPLPCAHWLSALNCVLMFLQTYNWAPFSTAKTDICQFICIRALLPPHPLKSTATFSLSCVFPSFNSATALSNINPIWGYEWPRAPLLRVVSHVITIIYKTHSGSVA